MGIDQLLADLQNLIVQLTGIANALFPFAHPNLIVKVLLDDSLGLLLKVWNGLILHTTDFETGHDFTTNRTIQTFEPELSPLQLQVLDLLGVPASALHETVNRFNGFARDGKDDDFGRGDSAYDNYYGDPTLPQPTMDVIDSAPFFAARIQAGDLGTKGGLVYNANGQVLRADGTVIDGLYATGNASAAVMGNDYAGAGATIGPSMAFGFISARHAAGK